MYLFLSSRELTTKRGIPSETGLTAGATAPSAGADKANLMLSSSTLQTPVEHPDINVASNGLAE